MKPIADNLSLDGHPVYVIKKLKNNLFNLPSSAKIVSDFIEEHDLKNVILVTHSKGGLIARYLIEYTSAKNKVKGIVAVAAPFSGSPLPKFISQKAFLELLPNSPVIKKLQKNKEPNKKIVSIFPFYDNHIWSKEGSWLEKARENIKVNVAGHHKILSDKKVIELIKKIVNEF